MKLMIVLALALVLFAYSSYADMEENDQQTLEQEDAVAAKPEAAEKYEEDDEFEEADLEEDGDVPVEHAADAKAWWSGRRRRSWIRRRGVITHWRRG